MNRHDVTARKIMALAYFHRYGWIAAMMLGITLWPEQMGFIIGVSAILFSVWTFVGYKCKWKHIFCSYQNASHQKMTPHNIRWHLVKKSDVYVVFLLFLVLGIAMFWVGIEALAE